MEYQNLIEDKTVSIVQTGKVNFSVYAILHSFIKFRGTEGYALGGNIESLVRVSNHFIILRILTLS